MEKLQNDNQQNAEQLANAQAQLRAAQAKIGKGFVCKLPDDFDIANPCGDKGILQGITSDREKEDACKEADFCEMSEAKCTVKESQHEEALILCRKASTYGNKVSYIVDGDEGKVCKEFSLNNQQVCGGDFPDTDLYPI
ncbi:MAG: hypothetical protein AAF310_04975 [Myxococcota bacterium]